MTNVTPLPAPTVEVERTRQWGDFLVEVHLTGAAPLPPRGGAGMGLYRPRRVLLRWETEDGIGWSFIEAKLVGPKVDYTGMDSAITVWRGDAGQPHCPDWLFGLIDRYAPRED